MPSAIPARAVDCHAHVFSAEAPAVALARYRPAYAATLESWRDQWRRAGVTHGVLVQPSFFGTDNGEMLAAIARAPDRVRGVAVVAPEIADAELDAMHAGGVRAVRLNLQGAGDYAAFSQAPWRGLFERIARRGWHLEAFVEAGRAPQLAAAIARSRIGIVFDHFANPGAEPSTTYDALRALARDRAVYVKLSGPYRTSHPAPAELARRCLDSLGTERVVWGSDWPWTRHEAGRDYPALRDALDDWVGEARAPAVLWDNAARLYDFD
jgi:predicted TIM-barrel fold metal-dependent hydrolase